MSFGCGVKVPIFITPKEREDYSKIENKKKVDTCDQIKKIIDEMPDNNLANGFRKDCGKGDHLKHSELLHFITSRKKV